MSKIEYTKEQRNFIFKMLENIPEVEKYWEEHVDTWDEHYISFYADLNSFVRLTYDTLVEGNDVVAYKVLDMIEEFLNNSHKELKLNIAYFFFEDLINKIEWADVEYLKENNSIEDKKYMKKFINMLGKNSKDCCREVDKFWETKTPGLWEEDEK